MFFDLGTIMSFVRTLSPQEAYHAFPKQLIPHIKTDFHGHKVRLMREASGKKSPSSLIYSPGNEPPSPSLSPVAKKFKLNSSKASSETTLYIHTNFQKSFLENRLKEAAKYKNYEKCSIILEELFSSKSDESFQSYFFSFFKELVKEYRLDTTSLLCLFVKNCYEKQSLKRLFCCFSRYIKKTDYSIPLFVAYILKNIPLTFSQLQTFPIDEDLLYEAALQSFMKELSSPSISQLQLVYFLHEILTIHAQNKNMVFDLEQWRQKSYNDFIQWLLPPIKAQDLNLTTLIISLIDYSYQKHSLDIIASCFLDYLESKHFNIYKIADHTLNKFNYDLKNIEVIFKSRLGFFSLLLITSCSLQFKLQDDQQKKLKEDFKEYKDFIFQNIPLHPLTNCEPFDRLPPPSDEFTNEYDRLHRLLILDKDWLAESVAEKSVLEVTIGHRLEIVLNWFFLLLQDIYTENKPSYSVQKQTRYLHKRLMQALKKVNDYIKLSEQTLLESFRISEDILNLKIGAFFIYPVVAARHATLLLIHKKNSIQHAVYFYNTGLGVEKWHAFHSTRSRYCQTFYALGEDVKANQFIPTFWEEFNTVISSIDPDESHLDSIYEFLTDHFSINQAALPQSDLNHEIDYPQFYDSIQLQGTCTAHVFYALLRHQTLIQSPRTLENFEDYKISKSCLQIAFAEKFITLCSPRFIPVIKAKIDKININLKIKDLKKESVHFDNDKAYFDNYKKINRLLTETWLAQGEIPSKFLNTSLYQTAQPLYHNHSQNLKRLIHFFEDYLGQLEINTLDPKTQNNVLSQIKNYLAHHQIIKSLFINYLIDKARMYLINKQAPLRYIITVLEFLK